MDEAILNAIRWHYYDCQRGKDSADPACNGMDWEILEGLERCVPNEVVEEMRREGLAWAEYELGKSDSVAWEDVPIGARP